jgi:hypothetical protein
MTVLRLEVLRGCAWLGRAELAGGAVRVCSSLPPLRPWLRARRGSSACANRSPSLTFRRPAEDVEASGPARVGGDAEWSEADSAGLIKWGSGALPRAGPTRGLGARQRRARVGAPPRPVDPGRGAQPSASLRRGTSARKWKGQPRRGAVCRKRDAIAHGGQAMRISAIRWLPCAAGCRCFSHSERAALSLGAPGPSISLTRPRRWRCQDSRSATD